jgi:hypothetical protein
MLVHSPICRRLPRSICIARSVVSYTNREGRARARLQWTTRIEALHFRQPGRFLPQVRCRGSGAARSNKQRRAAIPSGWQEKSVERSAHGLRRTGGPLLEDRLQYRSAWGQIGRPLKSTLRRSRTVRPHHRFRLGTILEAAASGRSTRSAAHGSEDQQSMTFARDRPPLLFRPISLSFFVALPPFGRRRVPALLPIEALSRQILLGNRFPTDNRDLRKPSQQCTHFAAPRAR